MASHLPSPPASPVVSLFKFYPPPLTSNHRSSTSSASSDGSSPPESPPLPALFNSPSPTIHPFSANAKCTQTPPRYQKRDITPPRTPLNSIFIQQQPSPPLDFSSRSHTFPRLSFLSPEEKQQELEKNLWDETIDAVITESLNPAIDLTNRGITHIPSTIQDIGNLVVLPDQAQTSRSFARSRSAPITVALQPNRQFGRTMSTLANPAMQSGSHPEIQLYLANNSISKLPSELFHLQRLTVLSLRSNNLTSLPPAIALLENLRELNVSFNQLQYLPAELLQLKLTNLSLVSNPFLPLPLEHVISPSEPTPKPKRTLSVLTSALPGVLSLAEISYRVLLSSSHSSLKSNLSQARVSIPRTRLQDVYELPLRYGPGAVPSHVAEILDQSLPSTLRSKPSPPHITTSQKNSIASALLPAAHVKQPAYSTDNDASRNALFNKCPSPGHHSDSIFVNHAEARYEWVSRVAGVDVNDVDGGVVPILWRGCSQGCLDFLIPSDQTTSLTSETSLADAFSGLTFTSSEDWDAAYETAIS